MLEQQTPNTDTQHQQNISHLSVLLEMGVKPHPV